MYKSLRRYSLVLIFAAIVSSCSSEPTPIEYMEMARIHLSEGRISAATIETRNAVKGNQENADARLLLGTLLLRGGDAAGAEKELRKARELGIQDAETRSLLASALLAQNKLDELVALTAEGLESTDAARLLVARSMGWFRSDDILSARQDAQQALKLDPDSADALLALARFNAAENNVDAAKDEVKSLLKRMPTYGEAWEFLGDLERFANRPEAALAAYSKAIENLFIPVTSLLKRSQLYVELENATDALQDLDKLSAAGVNSREIQLARGQLKLQNGDLTGALGHFEQALTMAPNYAPAVGSLALTHLLMGSLGQAEQYSKQLFTDTKNSNEARRLLAAVYLENSRFELAEDTIKGVIDSGDVDLSSMRLLNTALLKQAKYDDAVASMTEFLRVSQNITVEDSVEQNSPVLLRLPSAVLFDETVSDQAEYSTTSDAAEPMLSELELLFVSAVEHLQSGNKDDAMDAAETLQTSLPESAAPLNLLGRIHAANNNLDNATSAFEAAIQKDPANLAARQLLSALDAQAGDVDSARSRLEQIVKSGTLDEPTLMQLSRIEAQAGNESAMLDWIKQARSAYPNSAASALVMARYHIAKGDSESALHALALLKGNVKNRPDILQLEGASLILQKRFSEALPKVEQLVQLQPDVAQWRYLLAITKAGTGESPGAIDELNTALKIDPNHAPSQLALANADIQQGQLDNAFTRVEALRELIPGTPELEAIEARYEARKIEPVISAESDENGTNTTIDSTEAVLTAARQLWTNNERDKAIALLNEWLEANPEDFTSRLTLANSYVAMEQTDAAIEQYETVLRVSEKTLPAEAQLIMFNNLAWYLKDIDSERAVSYAQRAVEASPDSVAALDTLAMIHLARDDAKAAKSAFDKATDLGVENPTILFHGATIENALGNTDIARSILQPLVEGSVEFPEAEEAARLYRELQ